MNNGAAQPWGQGSPEGAGSAPSTSAASSSRSVAADPVRVSTAGVQMLVHADGAFGLLETNASSRSERLVATGRLSLPAACAGLAPRVVAQAFAQGGQAEEVLLEWGAAGQAPLARLRVRPAQRVSETWTEASPGGGGSDPIPPARSPCHGGRLTHARARPPPHAPAGAEELP